MKTTKMRKWVSGVLAGAMALAALPLSGLTASAEVYTVGDVDMDGVITGHDSAMVSRYLYVDTNALTEAQLALADVDGNGIVDQTDLETIHGQEVYVLGDVTKSGETRGSLIDSYYTLMFWSYNCSGISVDVIRSDITDAANALGNDEDYVEFYLQGTLNFLETVKAGDQVQDVYGTPLVIDEVSYNLMDADADGKVTFYDAFILLIGNARASLAKGSDIYDEQASYYGVKGRYDLAYIKPDENGYTTLVEK